MTYACQNGLILLYYYITPHPQSQYPSAIFHAGGRPWRTPPLSQRPVPPNHLRRELPRPSPVQEAGSAHRHNAERATAGELPCSGRRAGGGRLRCKRRFAARDAVQRLRSGGERGASAALRRGSQHQQADEQSGACAEEQPQRKEQDGAQAARPAPRSTSPSGSTSPPSSTSSRRMRAASPRRRAARSTPGA